MTGNINDLKRESFVEKNGEKAQRVSLDGFKGIYAAPGDLPTDGNTIGDLAAVQSPLGLYQWTGSAWVVYTGGAAAGDMLKADNLSGLADNATARSNLGLGDLAIVSQDATHRLVTDTEKGTWNGKQDAIGYTPEDQSNKSNDIIADGASTTKFPNVKAIKDYADSLVAGLLDYRGAYDASGNTFPASGGSGAAGAVVKGDMWIFSVAGTLGGVAVQIGDSVVAKVDSPGQTAGNWNTLNTNIAYVPVSLDGVETLTNKTIIPRVVGTTDDTTAVIDVDATDNYQLTAIANATTISTTGSPVNQRTLIIRLKDAGVAKGLTWDGIFRVIGVTLPTTTVAGKTHYIGCKYNSADSKWDVLAVGVEP